MPQDIYALLHADHEKVEQLFEQCELIDASLGQQRPHQAVLAAEQVQQHARAGAGRGGERAQRQVRQPVLQRVAVGAFE